MKKLSLAALLLSSLAISGQALANTYTITKEKQPNRMLVFSSSGGTNVELFSILNLDLNHIPYRDKTGVITGVSYTSASYSNSVDETAELCYHRAYNNNPFKCIPITPNFSDSVSDFNGLEFKAGITISVRHRVEPTGSFQFLEPNRNESISFTYRTN
ncbi:hypothetical protein JF50_16205 [Pseudoalteromonas luteoviolacea]|uniref:Uncharacterized protein n=1 Tax=Pseudoalteromonas luteoviolacea TaxID=43657 RepID=A0A0C1Q8T6_9GAMM|nr:hypothetical protein [Pseudoalteromonas luteoviolacea]KID55885.1 hypothetical protein JF50_16205 [Pseudoalteromonas luteoviolacea]